MRGSAFQRDRTLDDLATQFGLTPLVHAPETLSHSYTGVVLAEHPLPAAAAGAVLLGSGVRGESELADLIGAAVQAGAAAIVTRAPIAPSPAAMRTAEAGELCILQASEEIDWLRLASYLGEAPRGDRYGVDRFGESQVMSDLFDLANSLSEVFGGPVTIENTEHRILAFSADQASGDEARKHSVLGHRVPDEYTEILQRSGVLREVETSESPVFVDEIGPGIWPRVVMRIRAGNELLGSIWVISRERPTDPQNQALTEAAGIASIALFRQRASSDAARRLRTSEVLDLLGGGVGAREAAERLGYGDAQISVFAATHTDAPGAIEAQQLTLGDRAAYMQRLAGALGLYLHQVNPLSVVAPIGGTVYGVLPHMHGQLTDAYARSLAETFSERFRHGRDVVVGLGGPVEFVTDLQLARASADRALRVLVHHYRDRDSLRIATEPDVQVESLLLRMSDQLVADGATLMRPLQLLRDHDKDHATAYLVTLSAWLEAFGDAALAAKRAHVHVNTLRYRLRKLTEIAHLRLGDADERFALMLQLRLFPELLEAAGAAGDV